MPDLINEQEQKQILNDTAEKYAQTYNYLTIGTASIGIRTGFALGKGIFDLARNARLNKGLRAELESRPKTKISISVDGENRFESVYDREAKTIQPTIDDLTSEQMQALSQAMNYKEGDTVPDPAYNNVTIKLNNHILFDMQDGMVFSNELPPELTEAIQEELSKTNQIGLEVSDKRDRDDNTVQMSLDEPAPQEPNAKNETALEAAESTQTDASREKPLPNEPNVDVEKEVEIESNVPVTSENYEPIDYRNGIPEDLGIPELKGVDPSKVGELDTNLAVSWGAALELRETINTSIESAGVHPEGSTQANSIRSLRETSASIQEQIAQNGYTNSELISKAGYEETIDVQSEVVTEASEPVAITQPPEVVTEASEPVEPAPNIDTLETQESVVTQSFEGRYSGDIVGLDNEDYQSTGSGPSTPSSSFDWSPTLEIPLADEGWETAIWAQDESDASFQDVSQPLDPVEPELTDSQPVVAQAIFPADDQVLTEPAAAVEEFTELNKLRAYDREGVRSVEQRIAIGLDSLDELDRLESEFQTQGIPEGDSIESLHSDRAELVEEIRDDLECKGLNKDSIAAAIASPDSPTQSESPAPTPVVETPLPEPIPEPPVEKKSQHITQSADKASTAIANTETYLTSKPTPGPKFSSGFSADDLARKGRKAVEGLMTSIKGRGGSLLTEDRISKMTGAIANKYDKSAQPNKSHTFGSYTFSKTQSSVKITHKERGVIFSKSGKQVTNHLTIGDNNKLSKMANKINELSKTRTRSRKSKTQGVEIEMS